LIAWSQNIDARGRQSRGRNPGSRDQLFERADIVTIHLVLKQPYARPGGSHGAGENEATAWLINASRGPIVDEQALTSVLKNKQIAGAAIVRIRH